MVRLSAKHFLAKQTYQYQLYAAGIPLGGSRVHGGASRAKKAGGPGNKPVEHLL
jgi:hypothetical protein